MAENLDPKVPEKNFGHSARRHARRGFAGAGAFQDVSGIGMVELERPREVRVARAGPGNTALCHHRIARNFPDRHDFFPIGPVAIFNHHRDWAAEGLSVTNARQKADLVSLDLHSPAPAIPSLAPFQLMVNEFKIKEEVGWKTFYEGDQGLAMRLASRTKAQHAVEYSRGKWGDAPIFRNSRNSLTLKESFR